MKYTTVPNTDLEISTITLGTWVFSGDCWQGAKEEESIEAVLSAIDNGINVIDTAPIYGNGLAETIVGKAIKGKRDKVIIATKCGLKGQGMSITNDLTPEFINEEINNSLKRLDIDYVDIYQCHWPDPNTPIESTLECLLKLKDEGKIRHIGVSNFSKELLAESIKVAPIATLQNQYSMLERSIEGDILPFCKDSGVGVISYGPLAGGILSGKYSSAPNFKGPDARKFFYKYYQGAAFDNTTKLLDKLKQIDRPMSQIAINWVRQQEGITSAIVGARNKEQAKQNAEAANWNLSAEELDMIKKLI